MGNAISFRLNPKSEKDKQILSWAGGKITPAGFFESDRSNQESNTYCYRGRAKRESGKIHRGLDQ